MFQFSTKLLHITIIYFLRKFKRRLASDRLMVTVRYCSLVNKSSEKRAANGLLFTPSLHKIVSELVGA